MQAGIASSFFGIIPPTSYYMTANTIYRNQEKPSGNQHAIATCFMSNGREEAVCQKPEKIHKNFY